MMETRDEGVFDHDEEMVSLKAAENGKRVICVLIDDTDVFVLLVYWVYQADLELLCKVQMERWDRMVLNINATCADLGPKCLQLLGMHALSGCNTTSYPYDKGKISALNTLLAQEFSGLADVLGKVDTMHTHRSGRGNKVCALLPGTSMGPACFKLFTKKMKKTPK